MSTDRNTELLLDPLSRASLCRLTKSLSTSVGIYRRARAILLLADGVPPCEVARRVGLDRTNVFRWARRFADFGVSGLSKPPRQRNSSTTNVAALPAQLSSNHGESALAATLRQINAKKELYGQEEEEAVEFGLPKTR